MQTQTHRAALPAITLAALGVVFGDIGTSPLYALKECFHAANDIAITKESVLGILSIIFWSIMLIISFKYVMVIMKADNNGEGGIMALLALNLRRAGLNRNHKLTLVALGFIGASLFFGDGIITPAISVLSAIEGLSIAAPVFTPYLVPLAIGILTALFLVQRQGSAVMGKLFGPITLVWFLVLGLLGLISIIKSPFVLAMVSPHWAFWFIVHHPLIAFFTMSAVVLTITGGEALYADMGHFGPMPIRLAWFIIVLPCLLLNYAGQGALLLRDPSTITNPFYLLVPGWALYPMIVLATIAAVIASQAVITGVFSMTRQAIQLGYLPRLAIRHTSESEQGQIYVPFLNWLLFVSIVILILLFENSTNLAAAYGVAVTLTMLCDTILVGALVYGIWKWKTWKVALFIVPFIILDLILVSATSLKILAGGWVPMAIAAVVFVLMMTWKRGREIMFSRLQRDTLPLDIFIKSLGAAPNIVSGTAVFMTSSPNVVPHALLHNLKHNKVLHQRNILMTIRTRDVPYVDPEQRIEAEQLDDRFIRVKAFYGFKEQPDAPQALEQALGLLDQSYDTMTTSFFVSRERLVHTVGEGMAPWREKLFISMQRNTSSASDFFQIPPNRVVEMGTQIEI
ncbi:potassium transporter Kup [Alkanindiges hydrocarboniclasticus]|uniref:Probable potassium transport system protein Kup n=1 Tax=Alkanindiges hydrocarboniclasticus TaxID=1907941 RepID=A0A1S8CVK3_9GAMM|nr:potassium transporter Kup [Alkanindiges hydrocarboniclasticus]ONG41351.1 potassium transporter Kup [Alkanindiges hydrocarboniclasticus]